MATSIRQKDLSNFITSISAEDNILTLKGTLTTDKTFKEAVLVVEDAFTQVVFINDIVIEEYANEHSNIHTYNYFIDINMADMSQKLFKKNVEDICGLLSLRITFEEDQTPYLIAFSTKAENHKKLIHTAFTYRRTTTTRFFSFNINKDGFIIFTSQLYDRETASTFSDRTVVAPILRALNVSGKQTLIGGENPRSLSENAFNTFLALLKEDVDVYYILDKHHPLFHKFSLAYTDRIVAYKSDRYIELMNKAQTLLTSGLPEMFYPNQNQAYQKLFSFKHHVIPTTMLGLNNEYYTINQLSPFASKVDKLYVGSKTEERFASRSLGFNNDDIEIVPLPLQKTLIENTEKIDENDKLILLPVANIWQSQTTKFNSVTPYYDLATSEELQNFANEHELEILLVVPRGSEKNWHHEGLQIVAEDENIINILATGCIVISDYHPLALEFSLTQHPVVFYRPEEEDKLVNKNDDIIQTYENDLPGEVINNQIDLFYILNQYADNQFTLPRQHIKKIKMLFTHE